MIVSGLSDGSLADLRQVLDALVVGARAALGANVCGAYLVGSFALGAGDADSDVDFLIVTNDDVEPGQVRSLRELHAGLPNRGIGWAQHLDGSYVSEAQLRRAAAEHEGWWYVDNGSREVVQSGHDNTEVARWVLREHGIALAGAAPTDLVDVVTPERLRRESLDVLDTWRTALDHDPGFPRTALSQQQHVLALCRVLCTISAAQVVSKATAGRWALLALDPRWSELIRRAIEDRPGPWERGRQPADPALARQTREFGEYARACGHRRAGHERSPQIERAPVGDRSSGPSGLGDRGPGVDRTDVPSGFSDREDPDVPRAGRRSDYDATEPLMIAEVRRLVSRGEHDRLIVDDLRREDLDRIPWSGGPRHPFDVAAALDRRDRGEVDYLAVRAPNGWPVSIGGVDYLLNPDAGTLWQLGTHLDLRSLGLGTRLIAAGESRISERGLGIAMIGVEDTNDRAHALYARLGFADLGHEHATWDEVDENGTARVHHADVTLMRKLVGDRTAGAD